MRFRLAVVGVLSLVAVGAGSSVAAFASPSHAPRRDTFRGSIVSATGKYAGDSGRAVIYLMPRGEGSTRATKVLIRGLPCQGRSHCLRLSGRLTGQLIERSSNPDVGRSFTVAAHGRVHHLGRTEGDGLAHGTGFIEHGREALRITLTAPGGSVTLHALSRPVPGFTSP